MKTDIQLDIGPKTFASGLLPELIAVLLLADLGIAVVGTLVGALGVQTRTRELIVPILALPLMIPLVIILMRKLRTTEVQL